MKIKFEKEQARKGAMARRLVCFCIVVLTVTAIWAVAMLTVSAYEGWSIDMSAVLTYIGAAFGGELLLLAFKRVFAKPNSEEDETV